MNLNGQSLHLSCHIMQWHHLALAFYVPFSQLTLFYNSLNLVEYVNLGINHYTTITRLYVDITLFYFFFRKKKPPTTCGLNISFHVIHF